MPRNSRRHGSEIGVAPSSRSCQCTAWTGACWKNSAKAAGKSLSQAAARAVRPRALALAALTAWSERASFVVSGRCASFRQRSFRQRSSYRLKASLCASGTLLF